ncbi:phage tail protein, partial [Escherichia coli]
LGNDPNFATTVTNSLAGKMDKSANGSDIENVSVFLQNLGLGEAAKRNVGTGENQIPDMSSYASGSGWRKMPDGSIEQWGR